MGKKGTIILGSLIVLFGLLELAGVLFNIDTGKLCFPLALILLGVYLIFRPRIFRTSPGMKLNFFPNIRRRTTWNAQDEEILMFVGDIKLDLSQANLKTGETTMRVFGFVGDIDVFVPEDVGIKVVSTAFLTTCRLWGTKQDQFVATLEETSLNYEQAEKKYCLETYFFVADVRVDQVKATEPEL